MKQSTAYTTVPSDMDLRLQILETIDQLETTPNSQSIIPTLIDSFKAFQSDRFLITGIPMPNQNIENEIIAIDWPDHKTGRPHTLNPNDLIIQKAIDWPFSFILRERFHNQSDLARAAGLEDSNRDLLIIPVVGVSRFHGLVALTFKRPDTHHNQLSEHSLPNGILSLTICLVHTAFRKLSALNALKLDRKGQLTPREREIMALSALGKSAREIGETIGISELTVIAHVRNASLKLFAANRAECVLQAIRYHQIGPGAGRGFYEMTHEIFTQTDYDYRKVF